ncbi:MAG: peptidoglycan-binding domain-containing protein [Candidatus Kaiserbacteria bacterium]|nr:peptidoglycan-binding domain-containing protein [Candidatus Kaiserbacteria bacterium]
MQITTTKAIAKVAAVATGLAMATSMLALAPMAHAAALSSAQVSSILSLLSSFGADASTIANVQASLTGSAPVATTPSSSACSLTKDLTVGSTGAEVTCLQNSLKAGGYMTANATGSFGPLTKAAVIAWQKAKGISPAAGYFGAKSRAAFSGTTSTTGGTTTTTTTPITGNGLKVSLATDSPNNVALVQSQSAGEIAKYTFANPTGADIKVTSASFKRIGVSTDAQLTNVYLFDGEARITDSAGLSNSAFSFNDTTGIFTVPAGGTKTIAVRADLGSASSGMQVGVQLVSVASTGTLDSSVSFPINSYTQTVSSATLATVVLSTVTPTGSSFAPGNDTTVFQTTATVGTRAVFLKAITLTNRGSSVDTDFQNLKLFVKGVQVGTAAATTNNKVTFDFSAHPVRLETGAAEIRLNADIVGGSGESFDFQIRRSADVRFLDADLNAGITPTGSLAAVTANQVDGVALSVTRAANSPTSNVAVDSTSVKWGTFEFRATGDDLKIEQITASSTSTGNAGLDNGKVFLNGVQVGSTQDLTGSGTVFTLGSQMILKHGTTAIVEIYADAKTAASGSFTNGNTAYVGVSVAVADTDGISSGNRIASAISNVTGNTITISSSSLTATKYSGYSNQTIIAGTNDAKIGSFTLSTGSTEGVNVNSIVVDFASAVTSTMTDLRLVDNATGAQIGSTKTSVSTSNSFSVSGVNLSASATKTINVIANVKSGTNIGAIPAASVTTSTGGIGSVTGNSVTVASAPTLQTITVSTAVLTAAVNTGATPDSANVIAGSAEVKVGSFRFTAQYSPYTVQEVKVKIPANAATSVTAVTLKWTGGSATQALALSSGTQTYATATFTGLSFNVPMNTDSNLDVYVGIPTIASGATSGAAISVLLDGDEGFKAVDSSGASDTTLTSSSADLNSAATTGKGTMYVRKSIATLSAVALDSSILANGTNKVIGRVKVTADAAGDISWNKIVFTVSKTAAVTLDATTTIKLYDGANAVAGNFATTTGAQALQTQLFAAAATTGVIVFEPTSEQQIAAGTSKTYELRTTVGGLSASGGYSLDISVANPTSSVSTGAGDIGGTLAGASGSSANSLVWSDRSVISAVHTVSTSDWTNDYLVKNLPLTVGSLTATI